MLKPWSELVKLDISDYIKTRDKADYLPWPSCLKLLYDNGAEKVRFYPLVNSSGSSLFMTDQEFKDKNDNVNRCYEVRVCVEIDGESYHMTYPVMNGIMAVKNNTMTQNAVHKAQMRAFVKCVAINTGLGFNLWLDDESVPEQEDLSKHNIFAIKERMQIAYTRGIKKGMTTREIAEKLRMDEDMVKTIFTYFVQLDNFEKALNAL